MRRSSRLGRRNGEESWERGTGGGWRRRRRRGNGRIGTGLIAAAADPRTILADAEKYRHGRGFCGLG